MAGTKLPSDTSPGSNAPEEGHDLFAEAHHAMIIEQHLEDYALANGITVTEALRHKVENLHKKYQAKRPRKK